jgi:hypothetical protein
MYFKRKYLLACCLGAVLSACGGGAEETISDNKEPVPNVPENSVPIANAGPDISIILGAEAVLNGSASSDEDGDQLEYQWKIISAPSTDSANITFTNSVNQLISPSESGDYEISLIVSDGNVASKADTLLLTVVENNVLPVAVITGPESGKQGESISLSGATSNDEDGHSLIYNWSFKNIPNSSSLTSESLGSESDVSFLPDMAGEYVIQLIVNDGSDDSEAVIFAITALENIAPTVVANVDVTYRVGGEAYFYSTVNDIDSVIHTYAWEMTAAPEGSQLIGATYDKPYFTYIPDVAGAYTAVLKVSDGVNQVQSEDITATIESEYEYRYAIGGNTLYQGKVNEPLLLNFATSTSPNGKSLNYTWSVRSGPNGSGPSLTTSIIDKAETEFKADKAGLYKVFVQATDDEGFGNVQTINITLYDSGSNMAPRAAVDNIHYAELGSTVTFDARKSFDLEHDLISYEWSIAHQPIGSDLVLDKPSVVNFAVTPELPGYYSFVVKAKDKTTSEAWLYNGWLYVYEKYVSPSVFTAGELFAKEGELITFDVINSHGIDGTVSIVWDLINAPYNSQSEINNSDTLTPTFNLDVDGKYVFQVRLIKNQQVVHIDHLTVRATENAVPTANAGVDISVVAGDSISLDASESSDLEEDTLTYNWFVIGAEGNPANLPTFDNNTVQRPVLMLDASYSGQVVIGLAVSDGLNTSVRDELVVKIADAPPTARLEKFDGSGFIEVYLPYENYKVVLPVSNTPGDGGQILDIFHLYAEHANLTMRNIKIVDKNGVVEPLLKIIDFDLSLPADQQVELDYTQDITVNGSDFVSILLASPADTKGKKSLIELTFEIVETGETFMGTYELTSG